MSPSSEDIANKKLIDIFSTLTLKAKELTAERFTLYPFQEIPMEIPPEYEKYKFNQREAYDVLDDFDKPPDKLTDNQKVLRKKYLNIVLALMDTFSVEAKKKITQMIDNDYMNAQQREDLRKYALGNYEPAFNTLKRIINLLIKELDPNTTCNKTPFIIAISILSVFLVIMIIALIVSRL
jgi:hypothetical protein